MTALHVKELRIFWKAIDFAVLFEYLKTCEPNLVTNGNGVNIAGGVSFTINDDSIEAYYKKDTLIVGRIEIGNNCFIGTGVIILPGVTIADNCVIGAGSVVTKSFLEKGSVIAGVPAKKISTTKE